MEVLGFRVLIEPEEIKEVTAGGIVLPEELIKAERRATQTGTIVSIGPTAWQAFDDGEKWAKVGDKVHYSKYGGKLILDVDTGKELVVIADEDILVRI